MSGRPSAQRTPVPVSAAELQERLAGVPRVSLAKLPTPLDEAPRFSAALGGPRILIKREDLTGLAFGGNKTRTLEFRMGNALKVGADCIINGAAVQSNDCRQTAAAGAKLGLKVYLVLRERRAKADAVPQGNFLLDKLLGAEVITIGPDHDPDWKGQIELMRELAAKLRQEGHRPYLSHDDLHLWAVGYVDCLLELHGQLEQRGIHADRIYLCSNLMSQAGLVLGARCLGAPYEVIGISPSHNPPTAAARMAALATEAASFLGFDVSISADEVTNYDDYVGRGYGQPTDAGVEAIKLLAQSEGILLDPVYSGKGMAGLIDHVRRGKIRKDETVIFVHTGGGPAIFAYNADLMAGIET